MALSLGDAVLCLPALGKIGSLCLILTSIRRGSRPLSSHTVFYYV
jgi:hypothetical protein